MNRICYICRQDITKGDSVGKTKNGWAHLNCLTKRLAYRISVILVLVGTMYAQPATRTMSALPDTNEANLVHNAPSFEVPRSTVDKTFLTVHGVYLASIAFDMAETATNRNHCGYVEGGGYGAQTTAALVRNDLIEFAAVTVVDYLFKRAHIPIAPYVAPSIGTAKHLHGGYQWTQISCPASVINQRPQARPVLSGGQ